MCYSIKICALKLNECAVILAYFPILKRTLLI